MIRRVVRHARSNSVAYLALFVALGGTSAWAAGQITGAQIKDGSLTGADVLNDSLTGNDILETSLGKVPSATSADSAAVSGYQIVTHSQDFTETEANRTTALGTEVSCPAGKKAVGGGGSGSLSANGFNTGVGDLVSSRPFEFEGTSGWAIGIGKQDGSYQAVGETISATAYAVCVNVAN